MTSTLKGGGGVRKYPNFADKQYIKYGQKGGGGSKNPKIWLTSYMELWKPPNSTYYACAQ